MAALIGRHINKIDKKGRISVPKQFRDALSGQGFEGIYTFPSFKNTAVEACGEEFIQRIVTSLDDLDLFSDEQDDLASTILENSHQLSYDTEGRIVLPNIILKHANITSEAIFVGRGNRFQIWEPSAYEIHSNHSFSRAKKRGVTLPLRADNGGKIT